MAATNIHNIQFKTSSISADVGSSGFLDCNILSKSESNNFFFGYGPFRSSLDADEIDSIFLFSNDSMLYRKKFEDNNIEDSCLSNDGTVYFYTDEYTLISISPEGKQNFKRTIGIDYDESTCRIAIDYSYFFGYDANDDMSFIIFKHSEKKLIKHIIPDIEQEDENGDDTSLCADETFFNVLDRGFLILYPDNQTSLMFDFDGNTLSPTQAEINNTVESIEKENEIKEAEKIQKKKEQEAYLKEREEFSNMLVRKFGSNLKAAISFVENAKNVPHYQAETMTRNMYSHYSKEQLKAFDKQIYSNAMEESKRQFAKAKEDLKQSMKDSRKQLKETKGMFKSLFSRKK